MGTRGACGFHKNGKDKVTYNHYDSYPDYLGSNIIDFICSTTDEQLHDIYDKIILVEEDSKPTKEQIEECKKWYDDNVNNGSEENWYCLLRNAQGNLEAYNDDLKYMIEYSGFLKNGLFCEYGYVINLDTMKLEYYVGGGKTNYRNRYHLTKEEVEIHKKESFGYMNCKLVKTFDLDTVRKFPDDVLKEMNKLR